QGVPYPVFGVDDLGNQQMMYPGMNYQFPGTMVYETPMMQSGGWLNKYQDGGMPLDLPLKSANPGSPWAYESPQANGYLLPDVNRPELLNTGATEYKMEIDNDVTIPTVVNGQYMDPDQAYQRYLLTGEQFKPMVDPGSYSKFYDTVRPLGLMQYQDGGVKTFDEYEYTVKDGIYTIRTKGSEEWRTLDEGRSKAFQSLIDISNPTKKKKPADKGVVDKMFSDILGPYKKKVEPVKPKEETKPMVERSAFSMVAPTLDSAISGIEYPEKVINNEQKEIAKFRVDPEFIMSPYKDKDTAVEEYKKYPTYALRYKNTSDYTPEDITNIQSYLDRKGLYPEGKKQINPSDYTTPEQILELQRYLVKEGLAQTLGLSSTNATLSGKLDKNTTAAIEKFNKSNSKFTPGSLDTNTRDAIRNYRNISDAQSAIGIPTRNPFDLYDAQTQSPRVEDTYQAMSDFENELMKRGFFRGDVKYDFTPKEGKQLIGYKFMYNPDTDSDDAGVYGCAEYVNKMVCGEDVAAEDIREELGFKGDAWSISENLQAKGGKLIFAGLPERSQSPVKQGDDLRTYLKTTLNNPEVKTNLQQLLNTGNIKPGDVVNIFYEGSSETDKAFNQTAEVNGRFFTTHVGIVKKGKDGKLYVEHNVHKVLHRDPIQDFLDNKVPGNGKGKVSLIAGITRPNYYQGVVDDEGRIGPEGISYYQTEYGQFNPSGALANKDDWAGQMIGGKNIYDYLSVIENNKDAILKDIPITENEFGKLMRVARIIPVKETSASADYEKLNYRPVDESGMLKVNVDALKAAEQLGLRDEVSMGFTRLKDESNLNPNLRAALYNDDDTQLDDPAKAAIPTFYVLSKNYLYLKEVMNEYGIKLTSDQLAKLAGLGYNQSIGKIAAQVIEKGGYDNYINFRRANAGKEDKSFQYSEAIDLYDKQTMKHGGWLKKYQDGGSGHVVDPFEAHRLLLQTRETLVNEYERIAALQNNALANMMSHHESFDDKPFCTVLPNGQQYCATRATETLRTSGYPVKQISSGRRLKEELTPEKGWYPTTYDQLQPGDVTQIQRPGYWHTMVSTGDVKNVDPFLTKGMDLAQKGFFYDSGSGHDWKFESPKNEGELATWMNPQQEGMKYYTYQGNIPSLESQYADYFKQVNENPVPKITLRPAVRLEKGGPIGKNQYINNVTLSNTGSWLDKYK
ncbi:hypothetical protein EB077_07050, partial [bacterium]|nr:hypothetical protein [bacterium]